MRNMIRALWPDETPPRGMDGLSEPFKRARSRFELWKTSACREEAREASAMVKNRYTRLDTEHMAPVGPVGTDGTKVPVHLVYDQVMSVARLS